ncbi:hypothetical protein AGMMS49949_08480 [Alphaproteobacteria bacterium]|nr:hypothetical protein AGMMS49949_08480 [Alphaproteobacteria bacterium]GHS99525.1 hypothetical protein AGMMS50296_7700 [Alphaproteobacteria bacterium]
MKFSKLLKATAVLCFAAAPGQATGFYVGISGGDDYLKITPPDKEGKEKFKQVLGSDGLGAFGPHFKIVLGGGYLTPQKKNLGADT